MAHRLHTPQLIRLVPQAVLLLLGLLLWAIWSPAQLWALVATYAAAWLILHFLLPRGRPLRLPLSAIQLLGLLTLLLALPFARLGEEWQAFRSNEGFRGMWESLSDRLYLERTPAIAPAVVFHDLPQRFFIFAPQGEDVSLRFGPDISALPAVSLGHGLFQVDYDPRRDGLPVGSSSTIRATLDIGDGRSVERQLASVRREAHPRWFASAPEQGRASTVSEETDELFIISRVGLVHRVAIGDGPTDTAFFDQGRQIAVTHRYSSEVWTIDADSGQVLLRVQLAPFQVRVVTSPDENLLAVAVAGLQPGIHLLALPSAQPKAFIPLTFPPDWIAFGPDADTVLVSSAQTRALYRLTRRLEADGKLYSWELSEPLLLGRPVVTLARAPNGEQLYVATTDYRPDGEAHQGNHFIQDQILLIDVRRWQVVDQLLTARRSTQQDQAGSTDSGVSPMGIAVRQDASLLVAFAGTDEVWELPATLQGPPRITAGQDLDLITPHGVADLGAGFWAASSSAGGAIAVYDAQNTMAAFAGVAHADDTLAAGGPDSLDRQALGLRTGERAFYESTRTGIACQSCHLHADTDHSKHDIGQRSLLPTLTVRGIAGTAPYLRDASFPSIGDLNDHLAMTLYRGYTRELDNRRQALETYVKGLLGFYQFRLPLCPVSP